MLRFGCSYREIADHTCSATTLRTRCDEWLAAGVFRQLAEIVLDRGYDYPKTEAELAARGLHGKVAKRGKPAPIQVGQRWLVDSWVNNFRKLTRCTERVTAVIEL